MATILLIEDNELNRDMLSRRLEQKGYRVALANDGKKGIELSQRELPDLILLDMNLPEIDGWEAATRLKSQELTQRIPIIALTSHAMAGDRERALKAGCDEYETKPLDFPRLLKKIHHLVNGTGSS